MRQISVQDIITDNHYLDAVFDDVAINDLKVDLIERGQIQPIVLAQRETKYLLVLGRRVFRAVKELGWAKVKAVVYPLTDLGVVELRASHERTATGVP